MKESKGRRGRAGKPDLHLGSMLALTCLLVVGHELTDEVVKGLLGGPAKEK